MLLLTLLVALSAQAQAPPEVPVLDARLGRCSAQFTVASPDGQPVYLALVHVRVRYGAFGVKRMDLEVGTNADGKATIAGLPDKARPMAFDVKKDAWSATVEQNVETSCNAVHAVTLKPTGATPPSGR